MKCKLSNRIARVATLASLVLVLGITAPAQATITGLTNGNFEGNGLSSGNVSQSINSWFESSGANDYADWIYNSAVDPAFTRASTIFGSSTPSTGYIYQQIGTYSPNEIVRIGGIVMNRGANVSTIRPFTVELLSGNFAGADGSALVATSLGSRSYTNTSFGFLMGVAGQANFSTEISTGSAGVAGTPLWLRIQTTAGGQELFLDNLFAEGIPEPSCLAMLGLGSVGMFYLRKRSR